MREMVRKAGTALLMLFHSMWTTLIIIRLPVKMSAGPVQYTGMLAAQQHTAQNPFSISLIPSVEKGRLPG